MKVTIKVTGEGEDEKGAGGLGDLAGEIALAVAIKREVFVEEQPYYAEEWGQEEIYNLLQKYKEVN